ncbi:hypothetical protein E8E14_006418 [Neopestalotiopsis sp. 37M]|nr:hypothetical protein E8E14_006418 [Neopestalotiopsis sp. 37M]
MSFDCISTRRARINVSLRTSSSPQSPTSNALAKPLSLEHDLIRQLDQLENIIDTDEYEDKLDEIIESIMSLGKNQFAEVAAQAAKNGPPASDDLHSRLFPDIFEFRLKTVDGKPQIFSITSDESDMVTNIPKIDDEFRGDCVYMGFQRDNRLPRFSSKDVICMDVFFHRQTKLVGCVQTNGKKLLSKAFETGIFDTSLLRELISLQKINNKYSTAGALFQVPQLRGYIVHADTGAIVGLLRDWIQHGPNGGTLKKVMEEPVSKELREKWAKQIRETVEQLHEIDVIWGDGKPCNVIIDNNQDAWLIDFDGGYTDGWVDKESLNIEINGLNPAS